MSTYIVTNIRKFIHGVKSSSSYFYCHYSANSYSVGNSYNNSYNNNYSYNNYNYGYNQWFLICPVFPLIAATNNSNNNEKNAEFTNNYLLRFISKRMEDCKKKKDIQKRKNTLGKYSAWHSLIYNLEDVVLHDNIAAFIPDQPGFRYKGWLCMESILFLYGAWQSFITAGIDPYQAGVTLVYQKPYAPQASDSFVQLNAQTLDDNQTSVDELNLMRVSVDKYFTAYFSDSYQGGIKRLKSNDIDDNNPVLSHTRYANKPINKTLLPTSDPHKLICMPSKSLHDAITNNMCPPPLNPITNNMCPPPLNFITNNNVNNENISNKNNNNTNIIPLHFHIRAPRAKTNVTTKSKNNKKIKITKNKGNDKQNNKQLGYLPKKEEIKTMSDQMKMIVAELRKDSKLDDKNKSLLIRLAETDAKNMCNITNGKACCVYTGLILKKISIDDFTSEDIHKLKIKLFDCVKSKKTHLTSKHTYGAEIGGFESKHGHRGQYMLKSDSYIARIFYELLNKSPKFEKQTIEVAKKLFKKEENETDNDNDNDNDINDNKLNKRCLSPDDSLTGNPPAKRQKTMDTNIINNNTNDIALSFDNWNNDDLNNDSLPGLHLDSDDNKNNKNNKNDIDTLERRKSWLCERIELMDDKEFTDLTGGDPAFLRSLFDNL